MPDRHGDKTLGSLGSEILARIDALAAISESPEGLTRTALTPVYRRASEIVLSWMQDAGMDTRIDPIGNVVGRVEGTRDGAPALMLGSHLDTVRDAGKYDGMLGVVTSILCVDALRREGRRFPFAIECIAFIDEEGVRFGASMAGSCAIAGTFDRTLLERRDDGGTTMAEALSAYGLDPGAVGRAARRREDILAYAELHIEQGPVLEGKGLPVGCVTAINGTSRFEITLEGVAGHAGTVPMDARRDALAGAAECVLAVERYCRAEAGLVGTVGRIASSPDAINVIPGRVRFSIDLRAPDDAQRERAGAELLCEISAIAARRDLALGALPIHELAAAPCAPRLIAQIERAIAAEGIAPYRLASGAGHDGMALRAIADIGMIFVRCAKGISHNPAESITVEDADAGARVLLRFVKEFAP
jgi:allantoate deiminase